jgi:Tfp pilus assembly protein PilF
MAIAFIGERFSWHWPWRDSMWRVGSTRARASRAAEAEDSPHLASVRAAMAGNYPEEAVDILTHMDSREVASLSPNECIILSQWLDESGHPIAASRLLRQCISTRRKSEPLADIYLSLGLMRLRQGQPTAAYQYLLAVLENNPSKETERRARDALRGIDIHRSAR